MVHSGVVLIQVWNAREAFQGMDAPVWHGNWSRQVKPQDHEQTPAIPDKSRVGIPIDSGGRRPVHPGLYILPGAPGDLGNTHMHHHGVGPR